MWSHHENTILSKIIDQLRDMPNPLDDRDALIEFILSLVKGGDRAMVDLCTLAEKAFFHPDTKGSNSIKKVLPRAKNLALFARNIQQASLWCANWYREQKLR